jgi:hypothetical protein
MKQYNPNTKYGRKKAREQAAQNYANMTPEEKAKHDSNGCLVSVIIIVIVAIFFFAAGGNSSGFLKWISR